MCVIARWGGADNRGGARVERGSRVFTEPVRVLVKIRSNVKSNVKIVFIIMQVVRCFCQSWWKISFCCPCRLFFHDARGNALLELCFSYFTRISWGLELSCVASDS